MLYCITIFASRCYGYDLEKNVIKGMKYNWVANSMIVITGIWDIVYIKTEISFIRQYGILFPFVVLYFCGI